MSNIIVMPLIIPIITAVVLVFLRKNIVLQRIITLITMIFITGISILLLQLVQTEGILKLEFSGWVSPYGILFVADTFSVLMILSANIVSTLCLIYAF
ncbi:Na+/H+ antiporter subunit D, partial [Butyricicoccus sp. 1XD8-22]